MGAVMLHFFIDKHTMVFALFENRYKPVWFLWFRA